MGLVTALQESTLRMFANKNVPESLNYPHDAVGSDYDSLNFFQQRVRYWGTVAQLMDQNYAINVFYTQLQKVKDWRSLPVGVAAQKVQVSAHPDAYAKWETAANQIIANIK